MHQRCLAILMLGNDDEAILICVHMNCLVMLVKHVDFPHTLKGEDKTLSHQLSLNEYHTVRMLACASATLLGSDHTFVGIA